MQLNKKKGINLFQFLRISEKVTSYRKRINGKTIAFSEANNPKAVKVREIK